MPFSMSAAGSGTPISRVFLIGFMGAGKSTVGRLLAHQLGWKFFDIDQVIEQDQQATVASLFSLHGEAEFRRLEHATIQRFHHEKSAVISLGGGAIEATEVRSLIHSAPDSRVIFLDAPLSLLVARCLAQDGGAARPVLQNRNQLTARYDSRLTYYRNAHLTVATESLTPEKVAAAILEYLAAPQNGNDAHA